MTNITLKQVAKTAGVSIKTVSRVINGSPDVAKGTRERVEQVLRKLDYQPNIAARSLVSGKSNTIGVLVHHSVQIFHYPFFSTLLGGVGTCLNENKLDMLLRLMDKDSSYTELFDQNRVDGLIITNSPIYNSRINDLLNRDIPCVFTSRITLQENQSHWVDSDFVTGTYLATCHLIELGHRRIAIGTGPNELALAHLRTQGYHKALDEHNIVRDNDLIIAEDLFLDEAEISEYWLEKWFNLEQPPTAIIASDDLSAVNLVKELKRLGYRVPQDISVIGMDDTPLARIATPTLTSVRQQAYKKGYVAAQTLMHIIREATVSPIQVKLETALTVRDSTGPVPD